MMTELIDVYNKLGGNAIASFAASGALARQIEAGAPADIFVSADQTWMNYLDGHKLLAEGTRKDWLGSTLVLIAPKGSNVTFKIQKGASLAAIIGKGKMAIGDPASVPAGAYAKQAMIHLGIWPSVEKNIATAENVRVALMLVSRGEAPLGVVFGTDHMAARDSVKLVDTFPADSFDPISYPIAMIKDRSVEAKKFYDFLMTDIAKSIIKKHGFAVL
jgi:molybdate transport system substrate-binding protein